MNKKKIINDPVHGFITIPTELIYDIIEHPFFQRLRRIRQLGLTDYVYPGALHTRFHHALGAMHLMGIAIQTLRDKGHNISAEECEAAQIAILLHDIGHGPFSHAMEYSLLSGVSHEHISLLLMQKLNAEFGGKLGLAIRIFNNTYERRFFHQLVSSQLDIDRLDYLKRDCFFTGVTEGSTGASRILKMLEVRDDSIVVEEKGIYSIENFLGARRLMYWQVYLHKTTVSAEQMLIQVVRRAKYLAQQGESLFAPPAVCLLLKENITWTDFEQNPHYLEAFTSLDDYDIWVCIKAWMQHPDFILSYLSRRLIDRRLFRIQLSNEKPEADWLATLSQKIIDTFDISPDDLPYLLMQGSISNAAYMAGGQTINVLTKRGEVIDVAKASDLPNIEAMSKIVKKYYLCWPKDVYLQNV